MGKIEMKITIDKNTFYEIMRYVPEGTSDDSMETVIPIILEKGAEYIKKKREFEKIKEQVKNNMTLKEILQDIKAEIEHEEVWVNFKTIKTIYTKKGTAAELLKKIDYVESNAKVINENRYITIPEINVLDNRGIF